MNIDPRFLSHLKYFILVYVFLHRWPGIISPDPSDENFSYIIRYDDGTDDPKYYHIEFLGEPHSHAWVLAKYVQVYNTNTVDLGFDEKGMKGKRIKDQFQKSVNEAARLVNMSSEECLGKCVYKYVQPLRKGKFLKFIVIMTRSNLKEN